MKAPPWCSDDTGCPILKRPNTKTLAETYSTIDEIPTSNLIDGKELALVLLLDMSKQQILFQIPNTKLNWRYHYGCQLNINSLESKQMKTDPRRSSAGAPEEETEEACKKEIQEGLLQRNDIAIQSLRKAGMMLFSFPTIKKPMRVHVFEASVDSSSSSGGGVWTKFSDIPYTEMWADDILWLPWFVNQEEEKKQQVSFQGHFIFDGSPGPTSKLVEHNCQRY